MKKTLCLLATLSLTLSSPLKAQESKRTFIDNTILYSIPCIALYVAGSLLIKKNGGSVGAIACATLVTSGIVLGDDKKVAYIDERFNKNQEKFWDQIKVNDERQRESLDDFKNSVRQIIAEKFVEQEISIEELTLKTLKGKDFQNILKKELRKVANSVGLKNRELIQKVVLEREEEILDRITRELADKMIKTNIGVSNKLERD